MSFCEPALRPCGICAFLLGRCHALPYQLDSDRLIVPAVAGQLHEMELIKSKIYQLEQTHLAMKNK